jgi:serine/threonine protein kinase
LRNDGANDFAGRYELVRSLGRGAQGEVYAVKDLYEESEAALKLLAPALPGMQWVEAAVLRNLEDHHVLPIRNADVHMGQPYLVTALARHGSIEKRIEATAGTGSTSTPRSRGRGRPATGSTGLTLRGWSTTTSSRATYSSMTMTSAWSPISAMPD